MPLTEENGEMVENDRERERERGREGERERETKSFPVSVKKANDHFV